MGGGPPEGGDELSGLDGSRRAIAEGLPRT